MNLQKIKNKRDRLKVDKKDQILDQLNKNLFIEEYYNSYIKKGLAVCNFEGVHIKQRYYIVSKRLWKNVELSCTLL